MQQQGSNILPVDPYYPTLGVGSKVQNSTFFRTLHIEFQGNDECSNMRAHILPLHTPSTPWVGSKSKLFSESSHVAYQIIGNGT